MHSSIWLIFDLTKKFRSRANTCCHAWKAFIALHPVLINRICYCSLHANRFSSSKACTHFLFSSASPSGTFKVSQAKLLPGFITNKGKLFVYWIQCFIFMARWMSKIQVLRCERSSHLMDHLKKSSIRSKKQIITVFLRVIRQSGGPLTLKQTVCVETPVIFSA